MREALITATLDLLETSLFAVASVDPTAAPADECCEATVRLRGGPGGVVGLRIDRPLARRFAAYFVGTELDAVDAALTHGTVGELANILAGAMLPSLSDDVVDLAPPHVADVRGGPLSDPPGATVVRVRADEGVVVAWVAP